DQKQDQRELHHESMSLHIGTLLLRRNRTRRIRPGPTTVKTCRLQGATHSGGRARGLKHAPAESRSSRRARPAAAAAPSSPCPGSRTATSPPAGAVPRRMVGTAAPGG